jgi:hypothetical protein
MQGSFLAAVLAVLAAACGVIDPTSGVGAETIESGGGTVAINGVANEPTGAKVEAMRIASPLGVIVVETYPSEIGACYDVVFPDGRREANCLRGSGIDPARPVTGRPDTGSIEGLNGAA